MRQEMIKLSQSLGPVDDGWEGRRKGGPHLRP